MMSGHPRRLSRPVQSLFYTWNRQYGSDFSWRTKLRQDGLGTVRCMFSKNLMAHFGCVNAIEFSNDGGQWMISGGDDRRILHWNMEEALSDPDWPRCVTREYIPSTLKGEHHSNIFCLAFDSSNKKIYSGGNDEQVIVHDAETSETLDVFMHSEAVYGLAVDPVNESVFASAGDDGRILIYDTRSPPSEDPFCLASYTSPMHAVVYNPAEPRLLATANSKEGIGLWDIRKPKVPLLRYGGSHCQQSCMSVRINKLGTQIIALRRRLPPILFDLHSTETQFQFDHPGYYNSCTMKSCCFAGSKDEYIISGSDDFNLYVWKIPENSENGHWVGKAHVMLNGHRSIVNQVRYNPANNFIISSGVEKVVKVWSPMYLPGSLGPIDEVPVIFEPTDRPVYTHEEYISLVLHSGNGMTHDYSNQSMEEDPRMMAFFDSLVQRELEGLTSDDLDSEPELVNQYNNTVQSDSGDAASNSEAEGGYSPFTIAFASVMAQRELEQEVNDDIADGAGHHSDAELNVANIIQRPQNEAPISVLLPNVNDVQNDEAIVASNLPGQRPNPNRVSISSLIATKRNEYLASISKTDRKSRRRPSNVASGSAAGRSRPKRLRLCRYERTSSSNSNSSSSDSDSTQSSESMTDPEISPEQLDLALGRGTSTQQASKKSQLLKWKRLRSQVVNSDSDDSEDEPASSFVGPNLSVISNITSKSSMTINGGSAASDTDKTAETSDPDHHSKTISSPSCRESEADKDTDTGECEIGPHISKSSEYLRTKNGLNNVKAEECNTLSTFETVISSAPCTSKGPANRETNTNRDTIQKVDFKFKKRTDNSSRRYRSQTQCVLDKDNSDDSS